MASPPSSATMKAWVNTKRAPFRESLKLQGMPKPKPTSARPLIVQVKAAALNPVDHKLGELLPFGVTRPGIVGSDFAGVVVDGEREGFKIGDEVLGMIPAPDVIRSGIGSLAEYIAVAHHQPLVKKPAQLSWAEAAAVPLTALTATTFFKFQHLAPGARVFINGGSSGVGLFAIQMAKAKGLYVVTSCSERTRSYVESLKPDEIIDYRTTPLEKHLPQAYPASSSKAFDVVFDTIGVASLYDAAPGYVKRHGIFYDIAVGSIPDIPSALKLAITLLPRRLLPTWLGGNPIKYKFFDGQKSNEYMREVLRMLESGEIKPKIHATFDFDQVREAYDELKTSRAIGKVVVKVVNA